MDKMIKAIFLIGAPFLLSILITPLMKLVSKKLKIYDIPDERKSHKEPMPLLGGIAIYFATIVSLVLFILIFSINLEMNIFITFIIGISGVTFMGLIDDILSLSARRRLVVLFILALVVLIGCLQTYFEDKFMDKGFLVIAVTSLFVVLWIVAITNAINFSDGLDGLASCLSLISVIAFAIVFRAQGRGELALPTAVALGGALLGFLPYNISPAKIFMGDSGSMFIGFMLGMQSIMSLSAQEDIIAFLVVPIYFMIVPISDMCVSVLRRLITQRSIMQPDHLHFHHKLNERFKNHRVVVLILSLAQLLFAGLGLLIYFCKAYLAGWIGMGVLAIILCSYTVRYEIKERKKSKQISA